MADAVVLRFVCKPHTNLRTSPSTAVSELCVAPPWCAPPGLPGFLEWRDSKHSRLLWVSAGPGCGKSVLSRSLIDERRVCTNAMASTVCLFFFKDG
jgi:hypothetical protein